MKILYVSSVCTPGVLDYIFDTSTIKPNQAVQKFHRLLIEGFSGYVELVEVNVLTSLPVSPRGHKKVLWNINNDEYKGVSFQFIPFINLPGLKYITVFCMSFIKVLVWIFINRRNEKVIICDILNASVVWSIFIVGKLMRQNMAVIVTDLPVPVLNFDVGSRLKRAVSKISTFILKHFDFYVGLTQQLNDVINPNKKPFLLIEGLVDYNVDLNPDHPMLKNEKKILLYAGGIYEQFGVKKLLDAFALMNSEHYELHIYGSGDLEEDMKLYSEKDSRISYYGVVKNSEILKRLSQASLLINPRPTNETFAKFSFPSKNMEYMLSGTPVLTTKLPGMPKEYYDYVYLIEDESIEGIKVAIETMLSRSNEELIQFGASAYRFVHKNKSNKIQAKKIIDFLMKK